MILATGFLYTSTSNIFSNALHIFQVEIFPTFARATAAGTAYGMSRLSSGAMPFVLVPVLDRWGAGAMFARHRGGAVDLIVDIALFAPPTTGGAGTFWTRAGVVAPCSSCLGGCRVPDTSLPPRGT